VDCKDCIVLVQVTVRIRLSVNIQSLKNNRTRTILAGRAYVTGLRLSSVCLSERDVLWLNGAS